MAWLIGILLAGGVGIFASLTGLDRERGFYPVVLMVIASYYILFAAMSGTHSTILIEAPIVGLFIVLAVIGYKKNLWLVAVALAGHGTLDMFHPHIIENSGMPVWWPAFCMTFDLTAGLYLAILLYWRSRSLPT